MPAEAILPLAVVALFIVMLSLLVVDCVVYRRVVRRLKDLNADARQTTEWSSRWQVWRVLWRGGGHATDPSMRALLRTFRLVNVAYAVAAIVWMALVVLVLLPT